MLVLGVAGASILAGVALILIGAMRRVPVQGVLGVGIVFYALTLERYGPLLSSGARQAITTQDRALGAAFAVCGGWAMVTLVCAILAAQRAGGENWTESRFRSHIVRLSVAAVVSAVSMLVLLSSSEWPPTIDFLNDYGANPAIAVYQLLFMAWVGAPLCALGVLCWTHLSGWTRYVISTGCGVAVLWAGWKLVGEFARFFLGRTIAAESPVSVTLGLTALGIILTGLVMLATRRLGGAAIEATTYRWRLRSADITFHRDDDS